MEPRDDTTTTTRPRAPEQVRLDFKPPPLHPHPLRSQPQRQLLGELSGRATKARAIIDRLRQGPATTLDLVQVGGVRYHGRLQELRNAGFVFASRRVGDGSWEYRLVAEPAR